MNTQLRQDLAPIIAATLRAADPQEALRRHVRRDGDTLHIGERRIDVLAQDICLVAAGKAAAAMAEALLRLLSGASVSGVVVTKHGHAAEHILAPLRVIEAGHPVPDAGSLAGGEAVVAALAEAHDKRVVLVAVSGGASALLVAPHAGISLRAIMAINDALLRSGADIHEMNAVRSRIDRLKAGGLVRMAAPDEVHALILSDVIGDPIDVIASGLTADPRAHNTLIGNNTQACEAAARMATTRGYAARIVTTELRGDAAEAGARIAAEIAASPPNSALIYGGETTVQVRGSGKGGRCQELALAAALHLQSCGSALAVAALGTDGTDGPTDAAGALAFGDTQTRATAQGLNARAHLERNDSYAFFHALGDLIRTGPTGTNVADVIIALNAY